MVKGLLLALLYSFASLAHATTPCGAITASSHPQQYRLLLSLSNAHSLRSIEQIPKRLDDISRIFAKYGDRRGLFPTLYAPMAHQALRYLASEQTEHNRKALSAVMWHFAKTYLLYLNQHLLNKQIPQYWQLYYLSSMRCRTNPILTTSYALLAHLSFDLKLALLKSRVGDGLYPDYLSIGNALARSAPNAAHLLWKRYKVNILPLFEGLWAGKPINIGSQQNMTTILTFNALRTEAWMSSRAQHYSMGMFNQFITQGQLSLWRTRVIFLVKLNQAGID